MGDADVSRGDAGDADTTGMDGGTGAGADWRPTASRDRLARRAGLLARTRAFFAARGVLEVDTPVVVNAAVTDVHIHSAAVDLGDGRPRFLHTSPEYAMKRLLAAGSGDIYQICHVARGFEDSRIHNAEFTLVEWYRLGLTLEGLMDEVEALVRELLGGTAARGERLSYRQAFRDALGLDPLECAPPALERAARAHGYHGATAAARRDELLEFLVATVVGPGLGRGRLTFLHGYPASQAALARLDPEDPRTALRFELYSEGVELANGFHELTAEAEQRVRFERDLAERRDAAAPVPAPDERLLAALRHGLPDCTGVALGFDRVVMLACGAASLQEVLSFPAARA